MINSQQPFEVSNPLRCGFDDTWLLFPIGFEESGDFLVEGERGGGECF